MTGIIEFIKANYVDILAIWGCIITIASIIVKLTPNKTDDKVWDFVLKVLNALALNPNAKKEEEKAKLEAEMNVRNDDTTRRNLADTLR